MGSRPTLYVPARFNGPRESGQGGYTAGLIAMRMGELAEVSLRSPVPLDRELTLTEHDHGGIDVHDGETLVAEAKPRELRLEVPDPVGLQEARAAETRYRGLADGEFSHCFVCGVARDDSFGVTAGAVEGRDVVASTWTPGANTDVDGTGRVAPEFVWAALDCPAYFALYPDTLPVSFLARFTVRVDDLPEVGTEYVVMAWPLAKDGRKHLAGSALLDGEGEVLAVAEALLIEAKAG
ncbi:MAG: hypothetical protein U0R51_03630 [Solirubrobacterales bacterium]